MKVSALSMVAKIESPATHAGTRWPPRKYASVVEADSRFMKKMPMPIIAAR
jgi:hypothetical protein